MAKAIFYKKRLQPNLMATVTDINIHAIPVYDGQSASGLNPAQQGSNRSENFGQALSESASQYNKNHKKQLVKDEAADSSTVESAPAAVTETSAAAASNQGEARRQAINKPAEVASASTGSADVGDDPARQYLPVAGNALPKQAVIGTTPGEDDSGRQSLQALNSAQFQGSALTQQIHPPQPGPRKVEQALSGTAFDARDLDGGLVGIIGRQSGLKDTAEGNLLRSPTINPAQAEAKIKADGEQLIASAQAVRATEGPSLRQAASALSAILALPGLAEQAGKPALANSALAAAVVTQDQVAELDRRLRLQAVPMGGRSISATLTTDARPFSVGSSWPGQDGFADLLAKSGSTRGQVTQISAPSLPGQGLNAAQSGGAPMLPTLPDSNAIGGTFKLPSGFEIAGGTAQGQMVTPFSQPAWAQELAQQAKFMVRDQLQFVELKLKPANLGSVEIVLKQDDDQTTLMFFAKNPAVREALEASLQKLQKSFDDDGLQLEQTFVSDQSLSEHRQQAASEAEQDQATALNGAGGHGDQSDIADQHAKLLVPANDHLLDLWA